MDQVDHEKGIYKLLPQDELIAFLSHPLTASLYFRVIGACHSFLKTQWMSAYR